MLLIPLIYYFIVQLRFEISCPQKQDRMVEYGFTCNKKVNLLFVTAKMLISGFLIFIQQSYMRYSCVFFRTCINFMAHDENRFYMIKIDLKGASVAEWLRSLTTCPSPRLVRIATRYLDSFIWEATHLVYETSVVLLRVSARWIFVLYVL
jgi:hypothetical protein